jgi:hypothetical protein
MTSSLAFWNSIRYMLEIFLLSFVCLNLFQIFKILSFYNRDYFFQIYLLIH